VKRYVTSTFSAYYGNLKKEDQWPFIERITFGKEVEKTSVKPLHVFQGGFLETFFWMNSKGLSYWINEDQLFELTTYDDTAKYTAAAIANPERSGDLKISGLRVSMKEFAAKYNAALGTNIKPKFNGTLEDINKKIEEIKASPTPKMAVYLGFSKYMFNGMCVHDKIDNDEFPDIKPITLEEFLKANPDRRLPETN
jgi:hypothetical protein